MTQALVLNAQSNNYQVVLDGASVALTPQAGQAPIHSSSKWNGEAWLSIQLKGLVPPNAITRPSFNSVSGIAQWTDSKGNVHQHYVIPDPNGISLDGHLEHTITLNAVPASNLLVFSVSCSPNISWFYQPTLTQDEINQGVNRPPNVVGSYALYIDKAHNDYMTGKYCHIYALELTDSQGSKSYAPLNYDPNAHTLTATMDQNWLASAVYPVIIDPTLGYDIVGSTSGTLSTVYSWANVASITQYTGRTGDSITIFFFYGVNSVGGTLNTCAYSFSGGVPVTRLASSVSVSLTSSVGWRSTSSSQSLTNGTVYILAFEGTSAGSTYYYDTGSSGDESLDLGSLPATWSQSSTGSQRISAYCKTTPVSITIKRPYSANKAKMLKTGAVYKLPVKKTKHLDNAGKAVLSKQWLLAIKKTKHLDKAMLSSLFKNWLLFTLDTTHKDIAGFDKIIRERYSFVLDTVHPNKAMLDQIFKAITTKILSILSTYHSEKAKKITLGKLWNLVIKSLYHLDKAMLDNPTRSRLAGAKSVKHLNKASLSAVYKQWILAIKKAYHLDKAQLDQLQRARRADARSTYHLDKAQINQPTRSRQTATRSTYHLNKAIKELPQIARGISVKKTYQKIYEMLDQIQRARRTDAKSTYHLNKAQIDLISKTRLLFILKALHKNYANLGQLSKVIAGLVFVLKTLHSNKAKKPSITLLRALAILKTVHTDKARTIQFLKTQLLSSLKTLHKDLVKLDQPTRSRTTTTKSAYHSDKVRLLQLSKLFSLNARSTRHKEYASIELLGRLFSLNTRKTIHTQKARIVQESLVRLLKTIFAVHKEIFGTTRLLKQFNLTIEKSVHKDYSGKLILLVPKVTFAIRNAIHRIYGKDIPIYLLLKALISLSGSKQAYFYSAQPQNYSAQASNVIYFNPVPPVTAQTFTAKENTYFGGEAVNG